MPRQLIYLSTSYVSMLMRSSMLEVLRLESLKLILHLLVSCLRFRYIRFARMIGAIDHVESLKSRPYGVTVSATIFLFQQFMMN